MELLIDGVRYRLWTPKDEAALEDIVKEHAKDIFGEDSIYFDIKRKIRSPAGIGSIPDGYAITFGDTPRWYIVEVELSSHPLYEHIVPQMTKFSMAINDLNTQKAIVDAMYSETGSNVSEQTLVRNKIGSQEIHEFLSGLISSRPVLVIVIEEKTKELEEVCTSLHLETKVVEFKTFEREGVGLAVHAHLFEPIWKPMVVKEPTPVEVSGEEKIPTTGRGIVWTNGTTTIPSSELVKQVPPAVMAELGGTAKAHAYGRIIEAAQKRGYLTEWKQVSANRRAERIQYDAKTG